ncbi:protein lap4-like [Ochlerotatus camptorhynchus]|uniref:protein lap4-like n=1 Tax=Ochlerotatus camptorhynchus TaxID=644619 RepID=UPI0031D6FEEF
MNVVFWCLITVTCSPLIANHLVQATAGTSITTAPRCLREDSKKCVIVSFSLLDPPQEVILPTLKGKSTLQIKRGKLDAFSEKLANQLGTVEKLQLGPLELKKIFLNPQLLELTAGGNQIHKVEFPTVDSRFKLQVLDLSSNQLNDLTGFEKLLNLRELHLEDNAIQSVDLHVFKSMKKLEKLFLDRNQITTVKATERFELPVLEYLSISGNQIEKLDVTNWQLDSLTQWDVSTNKLIKIDGKLEERFPSLQTISVAKNEWHCMWLEDTLQRFSESFIMVQDRDEDCEGISPANICCVPEHNIDPANDGRLNELKNLENTQEDFRATYESQLGKLKSDNDSKLKALESRLKKLKELEKKKNEDPAAGDSNPMKSKFESLKQAFQNTESLLEQERQLWSKKQKENDVAQRKLWHTILELKRSREPYIKHIAELQAQFQGLRDLVRNKLEMRDTLKG